MSEVHWIVTEHLGPEGLAALEDDWRRLYAEMPNPSVWHSHEACTSYLLHLCPAPEMFRCLALSDEERVRAILPIEERIERSFVERGRGMQLRVWGMPWCEGWSITDAIGPEDDARRALLPAVIAHLRRRPDRPAILVLGRTRDTTVLWDGLAGLTSSSAFIFEDGGEYVIPTNMSVEEFMARLPSGSRQLLRRAARKFEALEAAAYVRAVRPEELAAEYEEFLEVEASGWKGKHGSAVRQQPQLAAYFRDLLERLTIDGHCEIHSLHAEGRCIASAFCVYTRRECTVPKSGYDESYANVAPGRLVNHKTLEWCCEDPAVEIVSEVSDAPWLLSWAPDEHRIRRAYVALRPVSGRLLLLAYRLRYGPVRALTRVVKARRKAREDRTQVRRGRDAE